MGQHMLSVGSHKTQMSFKRIYMSYQLSAKELLKIIRFLIIYNLIVQQLLKRCLNIVDLRDDSTTFTAKKQY